VLALLSGRRSRSISRLRRPAIAGWGGEGGSLVIISGRCVCVCVCITGGDCPAAQVRILCSQVMHCNSNCMSGSAEPVNVNVQWDVCFPSVFTVHLGFPPGHYSAYPLATAVVATGTAAIATAARPPPLMGLPLRARRRRAQWRQPRLSRERRRVSALALGRRRSASP
jgi:hypothetical protein